MSALLVHLGAVPVSAAVAAVPAPPPTPAPASPNSRGEEFGKASPVGLVVVLLLALATIALIVSMSRRIRRLPPSFDEAPAADPAEDRKG
jgi:hypothetical protein